MGLEQQALECLELAFGSLEIVVCSWPGCEEAPVDRDVEGRLWCSTHLDMTNEYPLAVTSGQGSCGWCGKLSVARTEDEGVFVHPYCLRSWALAKVLGSRSGPSTTAGPVGAYGRTRDAR
jgi:hypothetical protein